MTEYFSSEKLIKQLNKTLSSDGSLFRICNHNSTCSTGASGDCKAEGDRIEKISDIIDNNSNRNGIHLDRNTLIMSDNENYILEESPVADTETEQKNNLQDNLSQNLTKLKLFEDSQNTSTSSNVIQTDTNGPVILDDDEEFDFLKREAATKRSSSLKCLKTPPGTPHRKKVVRFADVLGLDLASVKTILNTDSPPSIPQNVINTLKAGLERETSGNRFIVPCFEQPAISPNFIGKVNLQKVCLENVLVEDLTLTGTIRVLNVSFHKSVSIRYTTNGWLNFADILASYVINSFDGLTDKFSFSLCFPDTFRIGDRLEFAVCYRANNEEFWDNNGGNNYIFECFAHAFPSNESDRTWVNFL